MRCAVPLLCAVLTACGNANTGADNNARDAAFREHVARQFAADCRQAPAPDAAQAQVLQRLCTCSEEGIRSSDIAFADRQDGVDGKIRRVQDACLSQIYGPADRREAR